MRLTLVRFTVDNFISYTGVNNSCHHPTSFHIEGNLNDTHVSDFVLSISEGKSRESGVFFLEGVLGDIEVEKYENIDQRYSAKLFLENKEFQEMKSTILFFNPAVHSLTGFLQVPLKSSEFKVNQSVHVYGYGFELSLKDMGLEE